ncbi:MAG: DUF2786 domain-containing protein [Deltaproteobacteria bacterium]|nr:DUF2786 domain-containing protein [Deltaproteobacteria bacterium]
MYAWENRVRFANKLRPAVLALSDAAARLGRWVSATRTLELSRPLVAARPWPEVAAVLLHEMAHQYVDEVLGAREETAHGETFRRVCEERGIDARAAGAPIVEAGADAAELDRVLERIRKLLALAGSPNQHEAEMAMRKAHELMLRHNIEKAAAAADLGYEVRHVGDPEKRVTRVEVDVMCLLVEYFFVKVIRVPVYLPRLGRSGAVYELAGTRANLEMALHVHAFLLATAERLWRENRSDRRVKSGRDRLSYQSGVIRGFREKLSAERVDLEGTGLVWVGDRRLEDFYRARHPRITSRTRTVRVDGAHAAGREAGRTVVLHKPVEASGGGGGGRLLRG